MALTKATYSMISGAPANVFDYMTAAQIAAVQAGTSTDDLTSAFEQAINTSRRVRVPKGIYKCNVQIDSKTIIEGDGSESTILKPYDDSIATMTYTYTAQSTPILAFWDYHSEIHGIGFFANSSKVGVGFTFGQTDPADFQTNDQLANNVKFFGCRFFQLDKGIQFPFGNIGTEIYSCGFSSNRYGVYTLNNKFGGADMHSGNKYFFGGEFSNNDCAFYANDTDSSGGASGINFYGTIFEFNQIAAYIYSTGSVFNQLMFDGIWFERNGVPGISGGSTVTIDSWSGTTVTTQTINKHTIILDGQGGRILVRNSFFTDVEIKATDAQVTAVDCHVENNTSNAGAPCIVADTSSIRIENSYTGFGNAQGNNITVTGFVDLRETSIVGASAASGRWFPTIARGAKIADYGPSKAVTLPLTTAYTLQGSFTLVGTVVADGRIYDECNEFTRAAFTSSQFVAFDANTITTTQGWYVFTMDAKVSAGDPLFYVWDRSNRQLASSMFCPAKDKWFTFAGYGYSAGGDTLFFDVRGSNATCTWRNSAIQMLRFDTKEEAQSFLATGAFAAS